MQLNPKEIKVTGKKETEIAIALVTAGGSDNVRPPQSVLAKAQEKLGSGSGLAIRVIEERYVALRGKRGLTIYQFLIPVKLV